MAAREVLTGAVLDLHKRDPEATNPQLSLEEQVAALRATVREVAEIGARNADERNDAVRLLRRVLDHRELGTDGPVKSDIRAFLARLGQPVVISRFHRQQAIERDISAFNADTTEALEILHAVHGALKARYGEGRTTDLALPFADLEEALSELERTANEYEGPDAMDLSREARS